jgi:hypothetical protein
VKTNTIPILIHQISISTNQVSSMVPRPKKLETREKCENCERAEKTSQKLCHEIDVNPSKYRAMHDGDNPSFSDESIKFTFFLTEH